MLSLNNIYNSLNISFNMKFLCSCIHINSKKIIKKKILDKVILIKSFLICHK